MRIKLCWANRIQTRMVEILDQWRWSLIWHQPTAEPNKHHRQFAWGRSWTLKSWHKKKLHYLLQSIAVQTFCEPSGQVCIVCLDVPSPIKCLQVETNCITGFYVVVVVVHNIRSLWTTLVKNIVALKVYSDILLLQVVVEYCVTLRVPASLLFTVCKVRELVITKKLCHKSRHPISSKWLMIAAN